MNRVPTELWHEIFIKLDLKDRLTCLSVCRRWYDILDQGSLLHTLDISYRVFSKMKEMIEHQPHRATQVEYLTAYADIPPVDFDKRTLCNRFPNLRELSLSTHFWQEKQIHTIPPFQFSHATCKLEKIKDFGECELAPQLAISNLCNNLKSLELDFRDLPASETSKIISQLKNMPVLEKLIIDQICFTLIDLEKIHSNLPSIESLVFGSGCLISGEIPQDVISARSITQLKMEYLDIVDKQTRIQLYKYIGNKYPSVNNLTLDEDMDTLSTDEDDIREVYNEGIFPLYQRIGSQVDKVVLQNYCTGLAAFRKFDDYGMKLKKLTIKTREDCGDTPFIEKLVQSQQSKYIQKLYLDDIIPDPIYMLSNMEVLESLRIRGTFSKIAINFTQIIDACPPTLTTLKLYSVYLTYDEPTSNITSIKHLKITDVEFTPVFASIIETSFPELSTLNLSGGIYNDVTISLLNHNLKEITFVAMLDECDDHDNYTVKSEYDNDILCHTIKHTFNINGDDTEHMGSFSLRFICPSVEQLPLYTMRRIEDY